MDISKKTNSTLNGSPDNSPCVVVTPEGDDINPENVKEQDRLCGFTIENILNRTSTNDGLSQFITLLDNSPNIEWKVYGRASQASSTNATQDAISALVELPTNGFDGINNLQIERKKMEILQQRSVVVDHPGHLNQAQRRQFLSDVDMRQELGVKNGFELASKYEGMPKTKFTPTVGGWRCGKEPLIVLMGSYRAEMWEGVANIDVVDLGCGMDVFVANNTILDLNSSTKFYEPLYFGLFGHGRSHALQYAEGSIVITRSHLTGGIVVAVMKRLKTNDIDPDEGKPLQFDQWRYAVLSDTQLPPVMRPTGDEITLGLPPEKKHVIRDDVKAKYRAVLEEHGTIVRHTDYRIDSRRWALVPADIGKGRRGGLFGHLNERLAGAPYLCDLFDIRTNEEGEIERGVTETEREGEVAKNDVITGNLRGIIKKAQRNPDDMLYDSGWQSRSYSTLKTSKESSIQGEIRFRMLIPKHTQSDKKKRRTLAERWLKTENNAGGILMNGQMHDIFHQSAISKHYPYLKSHAFVYVDCDPLPQQIINEMISGSRERIDEGHRRVIHEEVVGGFISSGEDADELEKLNNKFRGDAIGKASEDVKQLLDDINKLCNVHQKLRRRKKKNEDHNDDGDIDDDTKPKPPQPNPPKKGNREEANPKKQFLNITTTSPHVVHPGSHCCLSLDTNVPYNRLMYLEGKPQYCDVDIPDFLVPLKDEFRADDDDVEPYYHLTRSEKGYAPTRLYFKVREDAKIGAEGDLTIRVWNADRDFRVASGMATLRVRKKELKLSQTNYRLSSVQILGDDDDEFNGRPAFHDAKKTKLSHFVVNGHDIDLFISKEHPMVRGVKYKIEDNDRMTEATKARYWAYFVDIFLVRRIGELTLGYVNEWGDEEPSPMSDDGEKNDFNLYISGAMLSEVGRYIRDKSKIVPDNYSLD